MRNIRMDEKTALAGKDGSVHLSVNQCSNTYHATSDTQQQQNTIYKENHLLIKMVYQVAVVWILSG